MTDEQRATIDELRVALDDWEYMGAYFDGYDASDAQITLLQWRWDKQQTEQHEQQAAMEGAVA